MEIDLETLLELYIVGNLSSVEVEIKKSHISIHDLLDYYAESGATVEELVLFVHRMYQNY